MAAAIGMAEASRGRRSVICELQGQSAVRAAWGAQPGPPGSEVILGPNLAATTIDPDAALGEWIRSQAGPAVGRALGASRSFAHFVAAAPGARELVTITKAWELGPGRRWGRGKSEHDVVILDAPASGHGAAMLHSPRTFARIAGRGPIHDQAQRVWELVTDPKRSKLVGVTTLSELPVSETLELDQWLDNQLDRSFDLVICNRVLEDGYTRDELQRMEAAARSSTVGPSAVQAATRQAEIHAAQSQCRDALERGLSSGSRLAWIPEARPGDNQLDVINGAASLIEAIPDRG